MAEYAHCLLVVTAALSQVKLPYPYSAVNPNQITQSLIAVLAGLRVPFVCTETHPNHRRVGYRFFALSSIDTVRIEFLIGTGKAWPATHLAGCVFAAGVTTVTDGGLLPA